MSIPLTIDAEVADLGAALSDFRRRQIPFATALGITLTLKDAQAELRRQLPRRLTLRNKFLLNGIRIAAANKRSLSGRVFTIDEILRLQIEGGTKGGKGRPVPLPRGIRGRAKVDDRSPAQKVFRKAKRVPALRSKANHFEAPIRGGDIGLFKRVGKARYPIYLLWRLRFRSTKIDSSFDFEEIVQDVIRARFDKNFGKALARAIATAR